MEDTILFNRKFMLIAIFLVSLVAMSAVSANDLNATDEIASEDATVDDNLEMTQEDTLSATHKVSGDTFDDIQNAVNSANEGDTILLSGNYNGKGSHIKITKTLTVEGNGATLDANYSSKMFEITGANVKINNINFINGYGVSSGAIDWWFGSYSGGNGGKGLLTNCNFTSCIADFRAGAVYFCNSNLTMQNCHFNNNKVSRGGAVYVSGQDCAVKDCSFENNLAEYGGALFMEGGENLVDNCYFNSNLAAEGGAIYLLSTSRSAKDLISNSYFENNKCGAILFVSKVENDENDNWVEEYFEDLTIENCEFVNNYGASGLENDVSFKHSSNVEYANTPFTAKNCKYSFNFKTFDEIRDLISSGNDKIELSGNYLSDGRAIEIDKPITMVGKGKTVLNGDFNGPIFIITSDDVILDNLTFINAYFNETGDAPDYGDVSAVPHNSIGGMFIFDGNNTKVQNCEFSNNRGLISVIRVNGEGCIFENCTFKNNNVILVPKVTSSSNSVSKYNAWEELMFSITYNGEWKSRPFSYTLYWEDGIFWENGWVTYYYEDTSGAITWVGNSGLINNCVFSNNHGCYDDYMLIGNNIRVIIPYSLSASDVSMYNGGSQKYSVTLTNNNNPVANVYVKITVKGNTSNVKTDSNGKASIDLNLPIGTYDITSVYGDVSKTSKITVKPTVSAADVNVEYLKAKAGATFLNTDGKVLSGKQVTFKINGKAYTATTNVNGVATASIDLGVGNYTVTAINPVNSEQKQFKLVISKAKSAVSLASAQNNGVTTLTASLTPTSATGNVIFNLSGDAKSVAVKSGKAALTLSDLDAGNYTVTAVYNGDSNLNASTSNTVTFSVAEVYPILTAKAVTKTYGTATKLVVYLKDNKGNAIGGVYVKVVLAGVTKNIKTNSKGQAAMAISNAPGTYTAKITYGSAAQASPKIVVKKATPKITAAKKTFKLKTKTKQYTITLKVNGKVMKSAKVTLKVNGKNYSAKTNSKGKATFRITKLTKKGTFNAVIKYAGNKYYNKASKTVKITTKK